MVTRQCGGRQSLRRPGSERAVRSGASPRSSGMRRANARARAETPTSLRRWSKPRTARPNRVQLASPAVGWQRQSRACGRRTPGGLRCSSVYISARMRLVAARHAGAMTAIVDRLSHSRAFRIKLKRSANSCKLTSTPKAKTPAAALGDHQTQKSNSRCRAVCRRLQLEPSQLRRGLIRSEKTAPGWSRACCR